MSDRTNPYQQLADALNGLICLALDARQPEGWRFYRGPDQAELLTTWDEYEQQCRSESPGRRGIPLDFDQVLRRAREYRGELQRMIGRPDRLLPEPFISDYVTVPGEAGQGIPLRLQQLADIFEADSKGEAKVTAAASAPARRRRVRREELNVRAGDYLRRNPNATRAEVAAGIGCSERTVSGLPAWRAVHNERLARQGARAPKTVPLTRRLQETLGTDDELSRLVAEQQAERDAEEAAARRGRGPRVRPRA
jgi:hypothetical protein